MKKGIFIEISKTTARLLLGSMFIAAAILKLLSIDYFEIYIYSFSIFGFTLTTVLSRLVIATEILLGLGLIFKVYYKQVWWFSMMMMAGFTIFLIYVIIFRNDENCHCFGELVKLDPSESIYKNVVSIFVLIIIRKEKSHKYSRMFEKWLTVCSVAISVALPFVVFPMDKIYNKIVSKDNRISTLAFESSLQDSINIVKLDFIYEKDTIVVCRDSLARLDISDGKYIINYVSAGCKFCKMGAEKMMMIFERNEIDEKNIKFMIWGYDADIIDFVNKTNTIDCEYWFIQPLTSLDITFGKFPIYVWTDDGKIVNTCDSRDLEEKDLCVFLK